MAMMRKADPNQDRDQADLAKNQRESGQSTQSEVIEGEQADKWMQSAVESKESTAATQVRVVHIILNLFLIEEDFMFAGLLPCNLKLVDDKWINLVHLIVQVDKVLVVLRDEVAGKDAAKNAERDHNKEQDIEYLISSFKILYYCGRECGFFNWFTILINILGLVCDHCVIVIVEFLTLTLN